MDHICDILQNRRLYCAEWSALNDPMEGVFAYSAPRSLAEDAKAFAADIQQKLKQWRICALSGTFNSHLLWAHYANGFDGVAIEIELPDNDPDVRAVSYRGVYGNFQYSDGLSPDEIARTIAFSKYREWKYEEEIRVRSDESWYELREPICRVIAGHRLRPALFDNIQMICERQEIEFRRLGIGDEGLDANPVPPLS